MGSLVCFIQYERDNRERDFVVAQFEDVRSLLALLEDMETVRAKLKRADLLERERELLAVAEVADALVRDVERAGILLVHDLLGYALHVHRADAVAHAFHDPYRAGEAAVVHAGGDPLTLHHVRRNRPVQYLVLLEHDIDLGLPIRDGRQYALVHEGEGVVLVEAVLVERDIGFREAEVVEQFF